MNSSRPINSAGDRPTGAPASVAQLHAPSDWRPGGRGFNPRRDRQHSFVEIDHEIFSMVILSLRLIQEGQLSVSGERICTILVTVNVIGENSSYTCRRLFGNLTNSCMVPCTTNGSTDIKSKSMRRENTSRNF